MTVAQPTLIVSSFGLDSDTQSETVPQQWLARLSIECQWCLERLTFLGERNLGTIETMPSRSCRHHGQ